MASDSKDNGDSDLLKFLANAWKYNPSGHQEIYIQTPKLNKYIGCGVDGQEQ